MRKLKIYLIPFMLLSSVAHAQDQYMFGFDLGTNIAGQNPATAFGSFSSTPGVLFGAEAGYYSTNGFSIRLQLFTYVERSRWVDEEQVIPFGDTIIMSNKSTRNATQSQVISIPVTRTKVTERHVEIPLTLKHSIMSGERMQVYAFAGPVLEILVSGNWALSDTRQFNAGIFEESQTPLNIGMVGGIGLSYMFDPSVLLFLETGYTYGVTNLASTFQPEFYTRDIRVNSGVVLNLR
jgi:hypothetical protein